MLTTLLLNLLFNFTPSMQVTMHDELSHLYADSKFAESQKDFSIITPRNTLVGVHIFVENVEVGSSIELKSTEKGNWYELLTVPVEENTGLSSRTEQFEGKENPYVIRRAPFDIYEVLKPIGSDLIATSSSVALRFELDISADSEIGHRVVDLNIKSKTSVTVCKFHVEVASSVIPDSGKSTLPYTNWFDLTKMASYHNIDPYSPEHWAMIDKYIELMKRGRQNTFWVSWSYFFSKDLVLDKAKLKTHVQHFLDGGMYWIEGSPIASRPNGNWSSPNLVLNIGGKLTNTEEGIRDLEIMSTQIMEAIRDFGWEDQWIQHIADEPTDTNAKEYALVSEVLRKTMPGIPIIEATMSRELIGAVDIWCPQVQEYQKHMSFFKERQSEGSQVWTYTCLIPGGRWLNRMIDMERLRQVYFGWAASKYDIEGYLHWGLNQYKANPFEQSVVDHPAVPNTTNKLPAGDTHVIYPGQGEPWSGLRFEAHRIGLEDYELLSQLKSKNLSAYHEIMNEIFHQYNDYEVDVKKYRKTKELLLHLLD